MNLKYNSNNNLIWNLKIKKSKKVKLRMDNNDYNLKIYKFIMMIQEVDNLKH